MRQRSSDPESYFHSAFSVQGVKKNIPLLIFIMVGLIGMFAVFKYYSSASEEAEEQVARGLNEEANPEFAPLVPISKNVKIQPVNQRRAQSRSPILIGIIAGHRGFDSGTTCSDGLTEVQITEIVAEQVTAKFLSMEIEAETLDEFDPRLDNYSASALVSIHVDSCDYINEIATGYKIAGSPFTDSSQLSICLQQAYGESTELAYHPNSITPHMQNYHAFRKIGPTTPALIIEIGFLNLDRALLTEESDLVVNGLVNGINCFLDVSR